MGDMAGRGLDNCHSLVFDDGFCDATPSELALDAAASRLRAGEQTRSATALALGPETRLKSRRHARRPRGDSYARGCALWQTTSWPPGTRRTDYVFSLAEVGGKSGKAQSKNSSFSTVRHDATPGADVSVFQVLGDCRPRPVFVWRCHPRLASFDRTERSVRTLCVSAAEAPSSVERSKTSGQAADATIVELRLSAFRRACGA